MGSGGVEFKRITRPQVQRIFDINHRRHAMGARISVDAMVQLYRSEINMSDRNEQITRSFVDMAFTVWDRALSKPAIQRVVLEEEEYHKDSLFNSIVKLQAIVSKASSPDNIEFCFIALHDYRKAGLLRPADVSQRRLEGQPKVDNGKGLVDLLCYKKRSTPLPTPPPVRGQQLKSELPPIGCSRWAGCWAVALAAKVPAESPQADTQNLMHAGCGFQSESPRLC